MDSVRQVIKSLQTSDEGRKIILDYLPPNFDLYDFYNDISLQVAKLFLNSELSFEDADLVMNKLETIWLDDVVKPDSDFPEPAYSVYLVFDSGEFTISPDIDPVEKYTKPELRKILDNV